MLIITPYHTIDNHIDQTQREERSYLFIIDNQSRAKTKRWLVCQNNGTIRKQHTFVPTYPQISFLPTSLSTIPNVLRTFFSPQPWRAVSSRRPYCLIQKDDEYIVNKARQKNYLVLVLYISESCAHVRFLFYFRIYFYHKLKLAGIPFQVFYEQGLDLSSSMKIGYENANALRCPKCYVLVGYTVFFYQNTVYKNTYLIGTKSRGY